MEITLNTKKIDYQTAVEILNSNDNTTEKYTIYGPNLISKTKEETTTIYTYAGINIPFENTTKYLNYSESNQNLNFTDDSSEENTKLLTINGNNYYIYYNKSETDTRYFLLNEKIKYKLNNFITQNKLPTASENINILTNKGNSYNSTNNSLFLRNDAIESLQTIHPIEAKLYSEYEITSKNYNDFITNVEKTLDGNIKFYLIPQIKKNGDSYTLTPNEAIKDSITLCKSTTNPEGIKINNLTATINNTPPSSGDIYYNIKTYSHTTTNTTTKEEEINIQSQHQIYDNITPAYCKLNINYTTIANQYNDLYNHYITGAPLTSEGKTFTELFKESKNCWVNKSDINCVIDYNYFINCMNLCSDKNLYANAPNQIIDNNDVCTYLGYYCNGKIYNIYCVKKNNLPTDDWDTLSNNFITLPEPCVTLTGTTIYVCIPQEAQSATLTEFVKNNNITFTTRLNLLTKLTCSITEISKSHVINFSQTPPTCLNPYEVYYTIKTTDNLNVESPHLLIWRKETTAPDAEDPTPTYTICCQSYY